MRKKEWVAALGGPEIPGLGEEVDIGPVVHPDDRIETVYLEIEHGAEADSLHPLEHRHGA